MTGAPRKDKILFAAMLSGAVLLVLIAILTRRNFPALLFGLAGVYAVRFLYSREPVSTAFGLRLVMRRYSPLKWLFQLRNRLDLFRKVMVIGYFVWMGLGVVCFLFG